MVPILPELRKHLEDAFDPESECCISRYQTSNLNLRKVFLDILAKAGPKPWPRLFHNLRGSLQTDLADRFPSHVVTAWLGNCERVARAHYLKVTSEHIATATAQVGHYPDLANEYVDRMGQQVGHSLAESTSIEDKPVLANPTKTRAFAKSPDSTKTPSTPNRTRTCD